MLSVSCVSVRVCERLCYKWYAWYASVSVSVSVSFGFSVSVIVEYLFLLGIS